MANKEQLQSEKLDLMNLLNEERNPDLLDLIMARISEINNNLLAFED